jgi:hypothetical protein
MMVSYVQDLQGRPKEVGGNVDRYVNSLIRVDDKGGRSSGLRRANNFSKGEKDEG